MVRNIKKDYEAEEKKFDKFEKELKKEFNELYDNDLKIRRAIVFGYNKAIENEHHKHQVSLQCARDGVKETCFEIIDNKIKQIGNVDYSKTEVILALEEIKEKLNKNE